MKTQHTVLLPTEQQAAPCGCGEEGCGTCCRLDTLVAPKYFCGQLLTDQDLTTQVGWTRDKLRLGRFRHGWGVVCGLDVRCDPNLESGVIVTSGYAVSCCGDDIVVAADHPFDLSEVCQRPDPCADLKDGDRAGHNGDAEENGDTKDAAPGEPAQLVADWREELDLQVVDLLICYRPEHAEPRSAVSHDACGKGGACDYSRTRELFKLVPQPVSRTRDLEADSADLWGRQYERCMGVLTDFQTRFRNLPQADAEEVRRWLLDQPLQHFCFLHDVVRALRAENLLDERTLTLLLFLLVQDRRNAFLSCTCHTCGDEHGVPLARIWLERRPWTRGGRCKVITTDPYPPHRRPLSGECWPSPSGQVNAGRVIWHRWEEACTTMASLGMDASATELTLPVTVAALEQTLTCSPFVTCGQPVAAQVLDLDALGLRFGLGRRVVGFCGQPGISPDENRSVDTEQAGGAQQAEGAQQAQGAEQTEGGAARPAATRPVKATGGSGSRSRRPHTDRGQSAGGGKVT